MGRLPAWNQTEVAGQPVEQLYFRLADFYGLVHAAIAGRYIEIPADHNIAASRERLDGIEQPVHGPHVAARTGRAMHADDRRPSLQLRFRAYDPAFKADDADLDCSPLPQENSGPPFAP